MSTRLAVGVALDGVARDFETRYGVEVETEQDVRLVDGARREPSSSALKITISPMPGIQSRK